MVGFHTRAEVIQLSVENLELRGVGANLVFRQMRTTLVCEGADRNELQTVAGRTDFGVDLQAPLKLMLVIGTEWAFKREVDIMDMASAAGGLGCACCQRQQSSGGECECADHCLMNLSYSAGVETGLGPDFAALTLP